MDMAKNTQQSAQTIKQEREARRLEKVEAFKKQQARERRNRRIGAISGIVGGLAVLALIVTVVVVNAQPKPDPAAIEITGLKTFPDVTGGVHVEPTPVDYETAYGMNPPAGGDHWGNWLTCGIYNQVQENERAVHSLEHGAVWVTYDASVLTADEISSLQSSLPDTYIVMSPYEGLDAPVVASAWGAQVSLNGVDDPRLEQFITKYWKSATAPEPGAACTGYPDGPGRVG
jgi:hypothetical protein